MEVAVLSKGNQTWCPAQGLNIPFAALMTRRPGRFAYDNWRFWTEILFDDYVLANFDISVRLNWAVQDAVWIHVTFRRLPKFLQPSCLRLFRCLSKLSRCSTVCSTYETWNCLWPQDLVHGCSRGISTSPRWRLCITYVERFSNSFHGNSRCLSPSSPTVKFWGKELFCQPQAEGFHNNLRSDFFRSLSKEASVFCDASESVSRTAQLSLKRVVFSTRSAMQVQMFAEQVLHSPEGFHRESCWKHSRTLEILEPTVSLCTAHRLPGS